MASLICMAKQCAYNEENKCCKGDIMVGGKHANRSDDTNCESFRNDLQDHFTNSTKHPCNTISIDCEATKCVYNTGYKCHAKRVAIEGTSACDCKETACGTFEGTAQ